VAMKIGILLTGKLPEAVVAAGGEYDYHFRQLLSRADPTLEFETVDVTANAPLGKPQDMDGWLITGSRHGAYEDLPWIEPLKQFIREIIAAEVPLVGICFGHQIMADALGGRNVKSDKGWGLGVHEYQTTLRPGWLPEGFADGWSAIAIHQDQVVDLPPDATVLARSPFCEYAALAYGDPEHPKAISVQPHPEYTPDLLNRMIDARLGQVVPPQIVAQAQATAEAHQDGDAWAKAIVRYFRDAAGL
jgi:GMP synthase-like glutamine amidotransferase